MKPPVETEIKLPVSDAVKGRALLRQYGFRVSTPRVFERNLVLDDQRGSLRKRGLLLRVRGAGKTVTCTFKGPEIPGRLKRREETEFEVSELDACVAVFEALGYREAFRYEKYRTEFSREGEHGIATLDETPIGVYLELEGPARWIDRTAKALGFSRNSYITASYGRLYFAWCKASGVTPAGMTF